MGVMVEAGAFKELSVAEHVNNQPELAPSKIEFSWSQNAVLVKAGPRSASFGVADLEWLIWSGWLYKNRPRCKVSTCSAVVCGASSSFLFTKTGF
jgi:hypothetical protein